MTTQTTQTSPRTDGDSTNPLQRWAGIGGLAFVLIVIAQNVIRGAVAPANDAPLVEVLDHFANDRGVEILLCTTFVLSGLCLGVWLGGLAHRLLEGARTAWAYTGILGAAGVVALFSAVVGTQSALVVAAGRAEPSLGAIDALWSLHNGLFAVLGGSLALALLGLGLASVERGLAPRAFTWLAPLGALALAIGAAASPLAAEGSAMAFMGVGLIGFVIWLAFVALSGRELLRRS